MARVVCGVGCWRSDYLLLLLLWWWGEEGDCLSACWAAAAEVREMAELTVASTGSSWE